MSTCPRCHLTLDTTDYQGVDLESCSRCGGQWLDPEHLRSILDTVEAPAGQTTPPASGADRRAAKENLPCPSCGQALAPFNYAGDSGIILDKCFACGHIWLDAGELEEVLQAVRASRQGLDRDIKRFSADLHEVEVREDKREQQDVRTTPMPGLTSLVSQITDDPVQRSEPPA